MGRVGYEMHPIVGPRQYFDPQNEGQMYIKGIPRGGIDMYMEAQKRKHEQRFLLASVQPGEIDWGKLIYERSAFQCNALQCKLLGMKISQEPKCIWTRPHWDDSSFDLIF